MTHVKQWPKGARQTQELSPDNVKHRVSCYLHVEHPAEALILTETATCETCNDDDCCSQVPDKFNPGNPYLTFSKIKNQNSGKKEPTLQYQEFG